jgi:capsid protein
VIHNFLPTRISSDSGASWFSTNMITSKDVDWYVSNELAAAAVQAAMTFVVKSDRKPNSVQGSHHFDAGAPGPGDRGYNNDIVEFGQPTTAYVRRDEEVEMVESNRPNKDGIPFCDFLTGRAAQGANLSKQRITGDAAGANYASLKAAHEYDAAAIAPIQSWFIGNCVAPVRRRWTEMAVGTRKLTTVSAQLFQQNTYRFKQLAAIGPGIIVADEVKHADGSRKRMGACMTNLALECAKLGLYWRDVVDDIAEINKYLEERGVVADFSSGQGLPIERTSTEAPDEDELRENEESDADTSS